MTFPFGRCKIYDADETIFPIDGKTVCAELRAVRLGMWSHNGGSVNALEERTPKGRSMRSLKLISASMASLFMLLGLTLTAIQAQAASTTLKWGNIVGTAVFGDVVGVGSGAVDGAAPWNTTKGAASVNLTSGKTSFSVTGLILAVGAAPADSLSGLGIGTSAGVTEVKGTLVCNVDGTHGANSATVDTSSVALSFQGNATFKGTLSSIPAECTSAPGDTAFLIRIVDPAPEADLYIAFGAVLTF